MSALSIGLAWMALATVAFLALSMSALARTRQDLEAAPRHLEATPRRLNAKPRAPSEPEKLHDWLAAGADVSVAACRHHPHPRGYAESSSPTPSTSWGPGLAM